MKRIRIFSTLFACLLLATGTAYAMTGQQAKQLATAARNGQAKALDTLRSAAASGDPQAQDGLGVYYVVAKHDYAKAARWLRLAAKQGDANAETNLGVDYANGQGVPQNYAKVVYWSRLAASPKISEIHLWPARTAFGVSTPTKFSKLLVFFRLRLLEGSVTEV